MQRSLDLLAIERTDDDLVGFFHRDNANSSGLIKAGR